MTTKNIITVALIAILLIIIWKQNVQIAVQELIINDYQHTSIIIWKKNVQIAAQAHQLNNTANKVYINE